MVRNFNVILNYRQIFTFCLLLFYIQTYQAVQLSLNGMIIDILLTQFSGFSFERNVILAGATYENGPIIFHLCIQTYFMMTPLNCSIA